VFQVSRQQTTDSKKQARGRDLAYARLMHKRITDYITGGIALFWQRQSMFAGAALLAGYYFSARVALFCYILVLLSEALDYVIARQVLRWKTPTRAKAHYFLGMITFSTVLSAGTISLFAILVAREEGIAYHLTPLLFIFSAAIFAGMYNHQLVRILVIRLLVYGITLIYIPGRDLWISGATLQSHLWLQFAATLFVLYFIVDSALVFLRLYRRNLNALEALREEHRKTKQAYEAKSQFLAVVSHELRTPLTSIKGGLDIVNSGVLGDIPDKMVPVLDAAQKNSHRLAVMIDDLLDLQKIEAGEMSFEKTEIDLAAMVSEALASCKSYGDMAGVTFRLEPVSGSPRIIGDNCRLIQVMSNLLSNAAKFSDPGGEVLVRIVTDDKKARIFVEDHGSGIPENAKDKVFGRFSQVDSSDRRKVGGTGLGMNITRQIVEKHGGTIDYDSTLGEGTTFVVTFDRLPDAAPALPTPDEGCDFAAVPA